MTVATMNQVTFSGAVYQNSNRKLLERMEKLISQRQLSYNLSDPAMEDALHEIESMQHFAVLKPLAGCGYGKVLYRGLTKNINRLDQLAAFSNLLMGEKYLLAQGQCSCFPPK